jgi:hypothetical protein
MDIVLELEAFPKLIYIIL